MIARSGSWGNAPSTHNLGTCRMSRKASGGVWNKFGQADDVANLFISDGSQFTTGGVGEPDAQHRDARHQASRLHRRPVVEEQHLKPTRSVTGGTPGATPVRGFSTLSLES